MELLETVTQCDLQGLPRVRTARPAIRRLTASHGPWEWKRRNQSADIDESGGTPGREWDSEMGIQWRESLATGVDVIDSQHKELLARFDRLLNACEASRGIEELGELLVFLEEYVHTHFGDEEALQRLHAYPAYEGHHAQHLYFMEQIAALRAEIDSGGAGYRHVIETNHLLLDWLLNHITKVDAELGRYINSVTSR